MPRSPVGVLASVPVGVRYKTHSPLVRLSLPFSHRVAAESLAQVYAGLGGTALDLVNGYHSCKAQRQALAAAEHRAEGGSSKE